MIAPGRIGSERPLLSNVDLLPESGASRLEPRRQRQSPFRSFSWGVGNRPPWRHGHNDHSERQIRGPIQGQSRRPTYQRRPYRRLRAPIL